MRSSTAALLFILLLLPAAGLTQQASPPPGAGVQLRDIQGPFLLQEVPPALYPGLGLAALAAVLAVAGCILLRRRRQRSRAAAPGPDAIALQELDRARELRRRPLLYAERISAILRQYIEARFQVRSTRQTTREFFFRLQKGTTIAEVDLKIHARTLQECLEQCDRAKFAHGTPDQDCMEEMDRAIRKFIETTGTGQNAASQGRPGARQE